MWKIIFVECRLVGGHREVHRDPNAIAVQRPARLFSDTCQKMRGGKHVKVKKRRRQHILRFRADARKLILGSISHILTKMAPVAVFSFFGPIILALCIKSVTVLIFC